MRVNPKGSFGLKSLLRRGSVAVAVVLGLETVGLLGSYMLWRKMNLDQDFRYQVHQVSPSILEYYYKVGEKLGGSSFRNDDAKAWGIKTTTAT